MALTVPTRRPELCAFLRTYAPYLLFDSLCDQAYILKVKYISKNPVRTSDGLTEVAEVSSADQLPNLPSQFHELVFLKTVEMIATDMAMIMNSDGTQKFPGADKVMQLFAAKYQVQLDKDLAEGRRKHIARGSVSFAYADAERDLMTHYRGY